MNEFRIYMPAQNSYYGTRINSSDDLLNRYIEKEFPGVTDARTCLVSSVPKCFIKDKLSEAQAARSEQLVFQRLQELNVPGLWCVFFHGRSYGGASFRNERNGKLVIREHDFVLFATYKGVRYVALLEVKSTCDDGNLMENMKISDAKMIKNNKRSAQHQLRDHMEILCHELESPSCNVQSYICWPFLSSKTTDPQRQEMQRWKDDGTLHIFRDVVEEQQRFNTWFTDKVLSGPPLPQTHWTTLLQRFIILSCGVFVDEMDEGMMALLTQEQLDLLTRPPFQNGRPLIIHGAAGTGKTLLILQKLKLLHQQGELHERSRALYICYWPGIRCDVDQKLERLGLAGFVDTVRFYIAMDGFLQRNNNKYRHIFMDESEAICLALNEKIIQDTFENIDSAHSKEPDNSGCMWFLVDIHQAAIFLPKHSPNLLKTPDVVLRKVMRSTKNIYYMFQQFYNDPFPLLPHAIKQCAYSRIQNIEIGHDITGPPIYWAKSDKTQTNPSVTAKTVIDLCSSKGIKPNDICVLPFLITDEFLQDNINSEIAKYFVEEGFKPQALCNVESFLITRRSNHFLVPWALRAKGLEFKVVLLVIEDDDIDFTDAEDRRKLYIMSSRCTCMLVVVSSQMVQQQIDVSRTMLLYPFSVSFP